MKLRFLLFLLIVVSLYNMIVSSHVVVIFFQDWHAIEPLLSASFFFTNTVLSLFRSRTIDRALALVVLSSPTPFSCRNTYQSCLLLQFPYRCYCNQHLSSVDFPRFVGHTLLLHDKCSLSLISFHRDSTSPFCDSSYIAGSRCDRDWLSFLCCRNSAPSRLHMTTLLSAAPERTASMNITSLLHWSTLSHLFSLPQNNSRQPPTHS